MNFIVHIFLFISTVLSLKDPMYNREGKPSSYGINSYIKNNEYYLFTEYQNRIDTIKFDVFTDVVNLSDLADYDSLESGRFYIPDYIVLTSEEKYYGYEFSKLSKYEQRNFPIGQHTVKGVYFHELTHVYFNQCLMEMKFDSISISPEYNYVRMFSNINKSYGSEFIEEGVCEYVTEYLGEQPSYNDVFRPTNIRDFNKSNEVQIKYQYSVYFVRSFLDTVGIEKGIKIIIHNSPPTYDEIINPNKYFERLDENF